jgi:WhiB family transcriptional regulator, redox-sensing transcriptional regulator
MRVRYSTPGLSAGFLSSCVILVSLGMGPPCGQPRKSAAEIVAGLRTRPGRGDRIGGHPGETGWRPNLVLLWREHNAALHYRRSSTMPTHQSRSRFAGQRECGSAKGVLMSGATPRIYEALQRASLAAAITPVPNLKGAACAGRSDLFDPARYHSADRAHREARALAICARCPALGACRAWFASLPAAQRPFGVIAGRVHRPPQRKVDTYWQASRQTKKDASHDQPA